MEGVCIEAAHTASPDLIAEIAPLVRQLSTSAAPLELKELSEILASPTTTLLVARDGTGRVTGILTLVTFRIPTGLRAFIEDVVVDVSARREGIGEALTREAIATARAPVISDAGYVTLGGPDEATYYVTECGAAWHRTSGTVAWVTKLAATLGPKRRTRAAAH